MIVRQFLAATQHPSAGRRAEAASALARAYLHGNLGPEAAWEAKTALLALLDDPSPLVRRALAEACAGSERTPRPVAVALASDQPEIAGLLLSRSPVLNDSDLVDAAAMGCEAARAAIAGRHHLSATVAGALAEIGAPETLAILAANATARITTGRLLRMVERHGGDAGLREALLARPDLPPEVRHACAAALARSLAAFTIGCGWLGAERGERLAREAGERAVIEVCAGAAPETVARVVRHLRASGQLNAGLILRAMLSGAAVLVEAALADLCGLRPERVAAGMRDARGFAALHRRAGLPEVLLPAFTAALSAWNETASGHAAAQGAALSRRMIERALTACEDMPFAEAQGLLALLTRYEVEAARDEAREVAQRLAARDEAVHEAMPATAWPEAVADERPEAAPMPVFPEAFFSEASFPEASPPEASRPEPVPAAPVRDVRIDAVLESLPEAILGSLMAARAENERRSEEASHESVPEAETIPAALVASYRPDHVRLAA